MLTPNDMRHILANIKYKDGYYFDLKQDAEGDRWYVQIAFLRPDIVTGIEGWGYSGKRYVTKHMSKSEFVALCMGTVLALEEHEAREMFRYRGRRVFGPHIDVDALWEVARRIDVRDAVEDKAIAGSN